MPIRGHPRLSNQKPLMRELLTAGVVETMRIERSIRDDISRIPYSMRTVRFPELGLIRAPFQSLLISVINSDGATPALILNKRLKV